MNNKLKLNNVLMHPEEQFLKKKNAECKVCRKYHSNHFIRCLVKARKWKYTIEMID